MLCSFLFKSILTLWWGELIQGKLLPYICHCYSLPAGEKRTLSKKCVFNSHLIHSWLHMHALASVPSSIITGPNAGRGPSLSGNALDLERDECWEEGGLHFLSRATSSLLFLLITTMNILPLCSHPSIKPGETWGKLKTVSTHLNSMASFFPSSAYFGVSCVSGSDPSEAQTRLPPPHLPQLTHPSLPISFTLGG